MATVRPGSRTALLIVDAQAGVLSDALDAQAVVARLAALVARARAEGAPVLWVQHDDDELVHGTPAWAFAPPLAPAAGETLVRKHFNSSFEGTSLDAELARLGIARLVLGGAASNWCIRATAYGALDRGYDLVLVKDGHTTEPMPLADGRVVAARDIIDELNVAMTWVTYPGRRNAATPADEIDFGAAS